MSAVRNAHLRVPRPEFGSIPSSRAAAEPEPIAAALIVTDLAGCIQYINLAAGRMLGRMLEQVRGLPWQDCLHVIDVQTRSTLPDPVQACLATGKPVQLGLESVLICQGAEILVEGSVAPFRWLDDDVSGTVIMLWEVMANRGLMHRQL